MIEETRFVIACRVAQENKSLQQYLRNSCRPTTMQTGFVASSARCQRNCAFLTDSDSDIADRETFITVAVIELSSEDKHKHGKDKVISSVKPNYRKKMPGNCINVGSMLGNDAYNKIDFTTDLLPADKYLRPNLTRFPDEKKPRKMGKKTCLLMSGITLMVLLAVVVVKVVANVYHANPESPVIYKSGAMFLSTPPPAMSLIASPETKWQVAMRRNWLEHSRRLPREALMSSDDLLGLSMLIFSKNIYKVGGMITLFYFLLM